MRVGAVALGAGLVFCTCYFAVVATTLRGRAVRGRLVNSWASLMVFAFVGASFVIGIAERGGNGGGVPFAAVGVGLALSALMTDLGRRQEL